MGRAADKHRQSEPEAAPAEQRLRAVTGFVSDSDAGQDDRLIYERIRLGIMGALSVNRNMSFSELREILGTTDGNLSRHARKLEDAGYLTCSKKFSGRVPKTEFRLTAKGRRMFDRHLGHLEALINAARGT